ncbi:MAG TPA: hypothetical protein VFU97_07160 [Xanthobacteraceae bacterium]|jgi:hypothetical protein|nr:hypothetical protein [Xanthobacteraceae bacterium]
MSHLLAKRHHPRLNLALMLGAVWAMLAVVSAVLDIARMMQTW